MFRRLNRPTRWKNGHLLLALFSVILVLDFVLIFSHHHTFQTNLLAQTIHTREELPSVVQRQKIFIVAQFWSSENLLKEHWINAFLRLVRELGSQNIYVSILCNKGLDNTEEAVRHLEAQLADLGVARTIVLDPTTHEDIISSDSVSSNGIPQSGCVTSESGKERRRIPYLAELRNRCLEPLDSASQTFDRILFLNDVVFEPKDILTLLATNGGHFDVTCGLDYHLPPALYDTFVARDMSFRGPITSVFPYFVNSITRKAMLAGLAAPVTSCWNGVIAVDAAPYYKGLRFRAISDSLAEYYVEASECCLIHADLLESGQASKGIYINPAVRTAYVAKAYEQTHLGSHRSEFVNRWQYWSGIWVIRFRRWWKDAVSISAGQNPKEVHRRIELWEREQHGRELGQFCVVLEMQILTANGWKHVNKDVGRSKLAA